MIFNKENMKIKYIKGEIMKKLLCVLIIILSTHIVAKSQYIRIESISANNYPEIMMEFKAYDQNNQEIRSFNISDFILEEGCDTKNLKFIDCPPPGQSKVSYIFVLDKSASMTQIVPNSGGRMLYEVVIKAFEEMVKTLGQIDNNRWEASVLSFSSLVTVVQDFTRDANLLVDAVKEIYKIPQGQTDYNAAFLYDYRGNPGALEQAKKAKYKPVVIFITDGAHDFNTNTNPSRINPWTGSIISAASEVVISTGEKIPATIFALTLGFPMPDYLQQICSSTPEGEAIDAPLTSDDINRIIVQIINKAGTLGPPLPCLLVWESCCIGGHLNFAIPSLNIVKDTTYLIPDIIKPKLSITPAQRYFSNINPGSSGTINLTLKALDNFVQFNATQPVVLSNTKFTINSDILKNKKLLKDEEITVQLQYNSTDSNYEFTTIDFNSSACQGNNITASAGWLFQRNVNLGGGTLGNDKDVNVTQVLCNRTGKTIRINEMKLSGGNSTDFQILSPNPPFDLPTDSCILISFRFRPSEEGMRSTTLISQTSEGELSSTVIGDGSGFPEIFVTQGNTIQYQNADCKNYSRDTTIIIKNIGALPLEVSAITLSNSIDFQPVGWTIPITFTLEPDEERGLTVRFNPQSIGLRTSTMNIVSNSRNNSSYNINLSGTRDSSGFSTSISSIDLGQLCINQVGSRQIVITNTGNTAITINASGTNGIVISPDFFMINQSGSQTITIDFSSNTEGNVSGVVTLTEDYCNFSRNVNVTAEVVEPKISANPLILQSIVNVPVDGTITISNPSTRDLTITSHNVQCDEVDVISPPLPWSIPAGGSINVNVRFTPVTDNPVKCFIVLNGSECNFVDSVEINGVSDLATATIEIEKHTGLAGFNVNIPIHLRNLIRVFESGATSISMRINYDQNLLTNPTITSGTITNVGTDFIEISNMPLSALNGDILAQLTFRVAYSIPTSTNLEILNTRATGGSVVFDELDGEFTLNISSATIEVGKVEGRTGQNIQLPIYVKNATNLKSVHKNIIATIEYNYSLLEPIGTTPKGSIINDFRQIEVSIPVVENSNNFTHNLEFKAMLGTAESTQINLVDVRVAEGQANFTEEDGEFRLTDVCMSGEPRLFDPKGIAQVISITPNPAYDRITLTFESQEQGNHAISLYSSVGKKVLQVFNQNIQPGVYQLDIDIEQLATGSYLLIYETPTKLLTESVGIFK